MAETLTRAQYARLICDQVWASPDDLAAFEIGALDLPPDAAVLLAERLRRERRDVHAPDDVTLLRADDDPR